MSNDEIIEELLERYKLAEDAEGHIRKAAKDDLYFIYKSMWSSQDKKARQANGQNRPCLEFNLVLKDIKKLSNELRLNAPSVKVSPEDDKADVNTAIAISGLMKQILKNANYDTVVASAGENSIESSFGFARVITKWSNSESFEQDIDIDYIDNPFSVWMDVQSKDITGADAEWNIITDDIPRKEFESKYPDAEITSINISSLGDNQVSWLTEDTVRVAEYYRMEKIKDRLIEGIDSDGNIIEGLESELDNVDSLVITRERQTFRKKWMWYKVTGADVLDKKELAGTMNPVVAFYGRRKNIDNQKHLYSLIRFSKDANRMYNYWRSSEAEQLSQSQKAPYVGLKGQFKSDSGWKNANHTPKPYLEYDQVPMANGQAAPAPQRALAPEPPIGYISAAQSSKEDVRETMGFGNQTQNFTTGQNKSTVTPSALSSVAMDNLNAQGEMATYDFIDNINKSSRQLFRVINDLIPKIIDTERAMRILGEDDVEKIVIFNGPNEDGELYDLSVGKYDIDIDVGPDFATKRKETAESMMDFITKVPGVGEITGDLVAETQDWKNADKFAERIKKTIPPALLGDDDIDEDQLQVMLSQEQQKSQELEQQLEQALQLIQSRQIDVQIAQGKDQSATEREIIKSQTALEKQRIDTDGELKEETISAQSDIITTLINNQQELTDQLNGLTQFVQNGSSQTPLNTKA